MKLAGLKPACQGCHKDVHQGQFVATAVEGSLTGNITDCGRCHTPTKDWRPKNFDHNRDSRFKLEGAHQTVPCSKCHVANENNGIKFVKYKPIDPACSACHGATVPPKEG
jgi:hypothetical protein